MTRGVATQKASPHSVSPTTKTAVSVTSPTLATHTAITAIHGAAEPLPLSWAPMNPARALAENVREIAVAPIPISWPKLAVYTNVAEPAKVTNPSATTRTTLERETPA